MWSAGAELPLFLPEATLRVTQSGSLRCRSPKASGQRNAVRGFRFIRPPSSFILSARGGREEGFLTVITTSSPGAFLRSVLFGFIGD